MFIRKSKNLNSWQKYTLILPTVSVGNVGQLSADLIVSTLSMERVGYILHPSLLPCVGNNPYAPENSTSCQITTCCEVYESEESRLVVVQQRAPFIKGRRKEYVEWLTNWIKEQQFHQVVILTSSFAHERLDHQLTGSPFRILQSPKTEERCGALLKSDLGWKELELRHSFPAPSSNQRDSSDGDTKLLYMPGSGISKHLFESCQELPVLVLLMFVSEGDNAQDAINMTDHLNKWLGFVKSEKKDQLWNVPTSWSLVFGSTFDPKLFQ
ncbi:proteasome assembly chaperone 2-like [Physella acuta]|uniref:proteasome assembly chaperone 2-like n=1 Tax=Physella acuta TaxID=109671 RepID=UPI0027DCD535|nr:proteasome assembly chaperone 2-like [Physella acuta]